MFTLVKCFQALQPFQTTVTMGTIPTFSERQQEQLSGESGEDTRI